MTILPSAPYIPQSQVFVYIFTPFAILLVLWCLTALVRAYCAEREERVKRAEPKKPSACVPPCTDARVEPSIV